jgi:hypothetical protein
MIRAIEAAKKISDDIEGNHLALLEEINLHKVFEPVFKLNFTITVCNTIVAYIIYAYDNNSGWINISADRLEDKIKILKSLRADITETVYADLVYQNFTELQDVITDYLITITNWKWRTILTCFDFHAINIRIATEPTKSTDELEAAKINKAKGELLKEAIRQREVGENLLKEIKSEYVKSDRATQQDFGFEMTSEKNIDYMSWRQFIKRKKEKEKLN